MKDRTEQKDRETERPRDRKTERQKDRKTERQKDGKTEQHNDRKTQRQKQTSASGSKRCRLKSDPLIITNFIVKKLLPLTPSSFQLKFSSMILTRQR